MNKRVFKIVSKYTYWYKIAIKFAVPMLVIFYAHLSFFLMSKAACDCYSNEYGVLTVGIIEIVFIVISIILAIFIKNKKKEWKMLYTIVIIFLYFLINSLAFSIANHLYTSTGF